jgi:predicted phosphodiesterase
MSVYAVSDMHGCADAYHRIKKNIKPEDTVYCLGDCGDRGPQPWETIKLVATDRQFIYLKGNHEDMLVEAAREATDPDVWGCEKQRLLASNGGMDTLTGLLEEERPAMWIAYLHNLPVTAYYTNTQGQKILMCHAGCSLWADDPDSLPTARELMWDRLHYYDDCRLLDSTIVVHGHTPIKYLAADIGIQPTIEALRYADGKKYCIDAGTCRSHRAILFNLDTLESIEFKL